MQNGRSHGTTPSATTALRERRPPLVSRVHVPWECRLRPPVLPLPLGSDVSSLCVWCCTSPSELAARISEVLVAEVSSPVRTPPRVVPCELECRSLFDQACALSSGLGLLQLKRLSLQVTTDAGAEDDGVPRILVVADHHLLCSGTPWSMASLREWLKREVSVAAMRRGDAVVLECNDPSGAADIVALLRDHYGSHTSPRHPSGRWVVLLRPQLCIRRCASQQRQPATVLAMGSRTWAAACSGGKRCRPLWGLRPMLSDVAQWALAWSAWLLQDPLAQRLRKSVAPLLFAEPQLDGVQVLRSYSTPAGVDVAMLQCATAGTGAAEIRRAWCVSGWDFVVQLPPYIEVLSAGNGAQAPERPEGCSFCRMILCVRDAQRVARILGDLDLVCRLGPRGDRLRQQNTVLELPLSPWMSHASRRRLLDALWKLPQEAVESPFLPRGTALPVLQAGNRYATKEVLEFLQSAESKEVRAHFGEPFPLLVGLVFGPLGVVASKL